jgi:hypothetical protein
MMKALFLFAAGLLAAILFVFGAPPTSEIPGSVSGSFSFASMGDGQAKTANFTTTVDQIASLQPDFVSLLAILKITG